ncbi:uncharacterized protein LOC132541962 [Erinaceus europaeus]|uniref:Uncharacterized protein LOC132541962 n=1 Tax=Erinaceus europaeus TaxID=9365 RepID=A0ABM3YF87_ERIEU|nr:uncharacterized protein LOC132541962 [Erinaceus europaeus]
MLSREKGPSGLSGPRLSRSHYRGRVTGLSLWLRSHLGQLCPCCYPQAEKPVYRCLQEISSRDLRSLSERDQLSLHPMVPCKDSSSEGSLDVEGRPSAWAAGRAVPTVQAPPNDSHLHRLSEKPGVLDSEPTATAENPCTCRWTRPVLHWTPLSNRGHLQAEPKATANDPFAGHQACPILLHWTPLGSLQLLGSEPAVACVELTALVPAPGLSEDPAAGAEAQSGFTGATEPPGSVAKPPAAGAPGLQTLAPADSETLEAQLTCPETASEATQTAEVPEPPSAEPLQGQSWGPSTQPSLPAGDSPVVPAPPQELTSPTEDKLCISYFLNVAMMLYFVCGVIYFLFM